VTPGMIRPTTPDKYRPVDRPRTPD